MRFSGFTAPRHVSRSTPILLLVSLLLGCSQPVQHDDYSSQRAPTGPEIRVVDYQQVTCGQIWGINTDALNNPLYWLRAMDCSQRLSPAEARAEAHRWPANNWQSRLKQAVLLSNGKATPFERQQYLQRFDDVNLDSPAAIRSLITVWREWQGALLQLSAERTRYSNLQQNTDAQLDILRQQQISLQKELTLTQKKLESLTDIERQLSSRRSPDTTDNAHASDKPTTDTAEPASVIKSEDDVTP